MDEFIVDWRQKRTWLYFSVFSCIVLWPLYAYCGIIIIIIITGVVTTDKQIQETIGELEMRLHRHVSLTAENCGVQEINAIMCQFMSKLEGRTCSVWLMIHSGTFLTSSLSY